jgi:hypothetical protein
MSAAWQSEFLKPFMSGYWHSDQALVVLPTTSTSLKNLRPGRLRWTVGVSRRFSNYGPVSSHFLVIQGVLL